LVAIDKGLTLRKEFVVLTAEPAAMPLALRESEAVERCRVDPAFERITQVVLVNKQVHAASHAQEHVIGGVAAHVVDSHNVQRCGPGVYGAVVDIVYGALAGQPRARCLRPSRDAKE
jgi:hypothetical protein